MVAVKEKEEVKVFKPKLGVYPFIIRFAIVGIVLFYAFIMQNRVTPKNEQGFILELEKRTQK